MTWEEQLQATERFLKKVAPIARDLGIHMNVETHEEITTWEVVRLVEAVGPDVMGVTFDVANVLQRGEDPVAAAHRVGRYVRQTHLKDFALMFVEEGILRQARPCGQGVVDYDTILPLICTAEPVAEPDDREFERAQSGPDRHLGAGLDGGASGSAAGRGCPVSSAW